MITVLFDIDGTLIRTGGAGKFAFADTFREVFGVDEIGADVTFAGRSDRAIAQELMRTHAIEVTDAHWQRFVTAFVPRLERILPACQGAVLPGVLDLLDQLQGFEQVAVGLLTGNMAAGARAKLNHYQLTDRFHFGGFGDHWTHRNDIAHEALAAARRHWTNRTNGSASRPESVFVIGDTQADIVCARAIEAQVVAVATGGATRAELAELAPDFLFDDLSTSGGFLRQIEALTRDS